VRRNRDTSLPSSAPKPPGSRKSLHVDDQQSGVRRIEFKRIRLGLDGDHAVLSGCVTRVERETTLDSAPMLGLVLVPSHLVSEASPFLILAFEAFFCRTKHSFVGPFATDMPLVGAIAPERLSGPGGFQIREWGPEAVAFRIPAITAWDIPEACFKGE
jgi:hypothetical protein